MTETSVNTSDPVVVTGLGATTPLGGDYHLDHRQRVDVEVVGERLVELYVVRGDARDLVDDVGESGTDFFGACHVWRLLGASRLGLVLVSA